MHPSSSLGYSHILSKAWPIILANAAVPLLGLVDTAVIGYFGTTSELAALAVVVLIFNFIFWGLGFLRMGTSGFVARSEGEGDYHRLLIILTQASILALLLALLLLLFQVPILNLSLLFLAPPAAVEPLIADYYYLRILAAPATLLNVVAMGVFIGRGQGKILLILQLILNVSNAVLDILFTGMLGMGLQGVALGTCIAQYLTLVSVCFILAQQFNWAEFLRRVTVAQLRENYASLLSVNRDIFLRTFFLLFGFAFFTRISGSFGEVTLASNHILLQFVAFAAFFLDGYAFVLEALAGRALGAKKLRQLDDALVKTSIVAFVNAVVLASIVFFYGDTIIAWLTQLEEVQATALDYSSFAAIYILVSFAAFQLDGLFVGASYGRAMRNASIFSIVFFVLAWMVLQNSGNSGLWIAFIAYVVVRALSLIFYVPTLRRRASPIN